MSNKTTITIELYDPSNEVAQLLKSGVEHTDVAKIKTALIEAITFSVLYVQEIGVETEIQRAGSLKIAGGTNTILTLRQQA